MSIARDIRKSQFAEITESQSGDYFDLVRNGQNLKIKQSNLISDFGTIGTLSTRGEVTGTPVLYQDGTDNYIRNILSGSGITASLSPQDGVEIEHNFVSDKTGTPVLINETTDQPIVRSLIGGDNINITGIGDTIQIAYGAPASSKTVFVYSIADFPAAVAGVITLADDTEYYIQADVSTANRFVMGSNTLISGSDSTLITLDYSGAGIMITAADKDIKIKDVNLTCSSGTLFDVSSTTGLHSMGIFDIRATCNNVGTLDNMISVYFAGVRMTITTQGFIFTNAFSIATFDSVGATMASGAGNLFNLGTATFDYFTLDKGFANINTTGYVMTGLANSGNINANGLGSITSSHQFGTSLPSDTIFSTDDRWESQLNSNIPNSYNNVLATHSGATLTITGAATPVIIGATWTEEDSARFTTTAGGRFTYTGKGAFVNIDATITADIALGIDNCSFFVYINGVQEANSQVTREFNAGDPGNMSIVWNAILETNDYIEIWAQNDDAAVNIIIITAILRIHG